jgi:ankyrin repeat protein
MEPHRIRSYSDIPSVDPNHACGMDGTPLQRLLKSHYRIVDLAATVEALLSIPGVKVSVRDFYSKTPLHMAVETEELRVVQAVLNTPGAELNAQDQQGNTALHLAVQKNSVAIVRALTAKPGINLNVLNNRETTPADGACDRRDVLKVLLDANAKGKYFSDSELRSCLKRN